MEWEPWHDGVEDEEPHRIRVGQCSAHRCLARTTQLKQRRTEPEPRNHRNSKRHPTD